MSHDTTHLTIQFRDILPWGIIESINVLLQDLTPYALGVGLKLFDRVTPIKTQIVRAAMGLND